MDKEGSPKRSRSPVQKGNSAPGSAVETTHGELSLLTEDEKRLRARVIEHYAWVATWDREYAEAEYRRVRGVLPWLKL